jgi:glycosyltransferase involved in cell wall biosynthesis
MKQYQVLLVGTLPPQLGSRNYGGVAKTVWELATALRKNGIDLAVATLGKYYGGTKVVDDISIFSVTLNPKLMVSTARLLWTQRKVFRNKSLKNCFRLVYAVYLLGVLSSKVKFDIIHVHHVVNQIPLAADLLGIQAPIVATVHSFTELIQAQSERKKKNLATDLSQQIDRADFVTFVSQSVRQQGREAGVSWNVKDAVIYNGIEFRRYKLDFHPKDSRTISFVGSLEESKGVLQLVEAINYLADDLERVLWIGRGSKEREISQLMDRSKVSGEFYGFIENETAVRLMSESDLLVVPSASESFGLVYIESLYAGTPVIGYDRIINEFRAALACDRREEDWLTPFKYSEDDPQILAKKISQGMEIKKRGTYLEEASTIRQKVIRRFSWDRISNEYEQVYSMVLRKNSG